ncbi:MAG: hypothetical protein HC894_11920 [Microcoleus sp. SM1_3_4]|nr:hypothetical protein [Microcoleus sp. SM1_3_4]
MTNFGIGWETIPSFPPQSIDSRVLGFVPESGGTLPSVIPGTNSLPHRPEGYELVRVVVFGSSYGIHYTIRWLWGLNFAHISEGRVPMPAPGSSEMMSIVTKRIPLA